MGQTKRDPAMVEADPIVFDDVNREDADVFVRRVQQNRSSSYVHLPIESRLVPGIEPGSDVAIKLTAEGILIVPDEGATHE